MVSVSETFLTRLWYTSLLVSGRFREPSCAL